MPPFFFGFFRRNIQLGIHSEKQNIILKEPNTKTSFSQVCDFLPFVKVFARSVKYE